MGIARQNEKGNWVIPNSFQTPNFLVDELMEYLTPEENILLIVAVRFILGFQENIRDRKANISLSRFAKSGLSKNGIRCILDRLAAFRILTPVGDVTQDGQEYELQESIDQIDWEALKKRKAEKEDKGRQRSESHLAAMREKLKTENVVQVPEEGVSPDETGEGCLTGCDTGVSPDETAGVSRGENIKPTLKPTSKPIRAQSTRTSPRMDFRTQVQAHFVEITCLPNPVYSTQKQVKECQRLWWSPLDEIGQLVAFDPEKGKRIVEVSVSRLSGLTITDPNSILKTARSVYAELYNGRSRFGEQRPSEVYS